MRKMTWKKIVKKKHSSKKNWIHNLKQKPFVDYKYLEFFSSKQKGYLAIKRG